MNSGIKNPLAEMLTEETIALNVDAKDWKDAVRISGNLLVSSGAVEESYIPAMIEMVLSFGSYIVIAPGVALPHARPEDGVIKPCMSLITLKKPVNFGNVHNDPVSLVISFGTIDHEAHVKALAKLARIIGDKEKVQALIDAETVEQVENVLFIKN
jgi:mannitol/fructose-specific phosphotransferase system IIA component (Ntr-type)